MLVLTSTNPRYCPACGQVLDLERDEDWNNRLSMYCVCGAHLQKAPVDTILQAAEECGGDLQYINVTEE